MMNCQIRIRTDAPFFDILCIQDWLSECQSGFAFHHNKPGNNHYHVYLFHLERNVDAMRRHLGKYYPKECYSVSVTCGGRKRLQITYEGAYQYGTTKSLIDPLWVKGIPLDTLQEYHKIAKDFYTPTAVTVVTKEEHFVVRPDRVWERLRQNADAYSNLTLKEIKSKMAAEWLNNGKAIPRSADLHRYSLSLFMLNKYKKDQIGDILVPDGAFEQFIE